MKSPYEELCKSRFGDFLSKNSISSVQDWREGEEPPDFYLSMDGNDYAVEVTNLMEQLNVGRTKLPIIGIIKSLKVCVDEVEKIARDRSILHGTYIVTFSKPIDNFRSVRIPLQTTLLQYIENTQESTDALEQTAFRSGRQTCSIKKLHSQANQIRMHGPTISKWEGEAAEGICALLEDRIEDKRQKLQNISQPKILLLYDLYHFADPIMFSNCVSGFSALTHFDTIFVVQSNADGFILYSQNPLLL
jgi:hypothetical protein